MWMSPELLSPEQPNSKEAKPTKESDVYALGVLIYEVCTIFAALTQYLKQRINRSFADIGRFRNCANRRRWITSEKGNSQTDPAMGLQILFGELWKAVGRLDVKIARARRL